MVKIMSITVTGKIEQPGVGLGTWAIITETGETYELKDPPPQLCQEHPKVKITGIIRDDIMTLAMIGPVLEVNSFEIITV